MGPVPARPISVNPELNFCSVFIFFDSLVLFTLSNIFVLSLLHLGVEAEKCIL